MVCYEFGLDPSQHVSLRVACPKPLAARLPTPYAPEFISLALDPSILSHKLGVYDLQVHAGAAHETGHESAAELATEETVQEESKPPDQIHAEDEKKQEQQQPEDEEGKNPFLYSKFKAQIEQIDVK